MKEMRRMLFYGMLICLLCLPLLVLGTLWIRNEKSKVKQAHCLSQLRGIGYCVSLYSEEHNGKFPRNLQELVGDKDITTAPFLFVCPGSGGLTGALTNVLSWTDYYYVHLPRTGNSSGDCALIYDRRLSNHRGHGINVVIVGTLRTPFPPPSALFWDSNAKWVRKFSEQRPDLAIPIPQ